MSWIELKEKNKSALDKPLSQIARLEKEIDQAIAHLTQCIEYMWELKNQVHNIEQALHLSGNDSPALMRKRSELNAEVEQLQTAIIQSGLEMKIARNQGQLEALKAGGAPAPKRHFHEALVSA